MPSRRERKKMRRQGKEPGKDEEKEKEQKEKKKEEEPDDSRNPFARFYEDKYKLLLLIPFLILIAAFVVIGVHWSSTGDFVDKDVSLQGGLTINILTDQAINTDDLEEQLNAEFPDGDVRARAISELGEQRGVIVDASDVDQETLVNSLSSRINNFEDNHSIESIGPTLGSNFFKQTARALWIAFLFMGMVVFLYFAEELKAKIAVGFASVITGFFIWFSNGAVMLTLAVLLTIGLGYSYTKYSIPSAAVVLAAFSDIVGTIAVMNILGIRLSTAGIAALLMLIGYSVDTDILLSTRVLKRTKGSVLDRMYSSIKTGLTMNVTTLTAISVALFISQSETISQIMTILLIGLIIDVINTWLQNTGIIRWYLEEQGIV